MNAGLPGTGIGGLFYIASALWMPAHRALNGRTHDGNDWRRVAVQAGIAGGVLGSLFLTGWLLGLMLAPEAGAVAAAGAGSGAVRNAHNVIRWVAVIGTAGLLLAVLLAVEGLHLAMQFRGRVASRASAPRVPKWRRTLRHVA